jgi:hypothetical protein
MSKLKMTDEDIPAAKIWNRHLSGWPRVIAWALLIASLLLALRGYLEFTEMRVDAGWLWVISAATAVAIMLGIAGVTKCLNGWPYVRRALIALGCVIGLIAAFYLEENIRGRIAWNSFQTQGQKKGERFDFASFVPPTEPDERNFAMAPIVATSYGMLLDRHGRIKKPLDTNIQNLLSMPLAAQWSSPPNGFGNWQACRPANLKEWQEYYHSLSMSTNVFPVPRQPQSPAADVLLALSIYSNRVEELRAAAELPESRYPLTYESKETFSIMLPHLTGLQSSVLLLEARAVAELESGKNQAALNDISLGLCLTDKVRSEPFIVSRLVRIRMLHSLVQPIWEGLAQHRWNASQLAELERLLGGFDFVTDYQAAMRAENACNVTMLEYLRRNPRTARELSSTMRGDRDRRIELVCLLAPNGWFYQNQRNTAKFIIESLLPISSLASNSFSPTAITNAEIRLRQTSDAPYTFLANLMVAHLGRAAYEFALAEDTVNLATTACALERYRLAKGKYPATLDALVPQYIAAIPKDAISGQPLNYQVGNNGRFVLYSVGRNETDDDGMVHLGAKGDVDLDQGDVVWKYPDTSKRSASP